MHAGRDESFQHGQVVIRSSVAADKAFKKEVERADQHHCADSGMVAQTGTAVGI